MEKVVTTRDACYLIGKSKDLFSPIKEALLNSFDAIIQRKRIKTDFNPQISLSFYFKTEHNLLNENSYIFDSFSIEDNGIGFIEENKKNFHSFASRRKGLNNKGTGTIQFFWRFNVISVDSFYEENNKFMHFIGKYHIDDNEDNEKTSEEYSNKFNKTIIKLSNFRNEDDENDQYCNYLKDKNLLRQDILKNFLLKLYLGNKDHNDLKLIVNVYLDNKIYYNFYFDKETIPQPDKTKEITINTKQAIVNRFDDSNKIDITWKNVAPDYKLLIQRFKLPSNEIDENVIYACSKEVVVETLKFNAIKSKCEIFDNSRYLTCISGDLFDDPQYLNSTSDKFIFIEKKDIESDIREGNLFNIENKYILKDDISDKINEGLNYIYDDVKEIKDQHLENINRLAKQYGISSDDVQNTRTNMNDSNDEIIKNLFITQARRNAKENIKIQETYEEIKNLKLKSLNPTDKEDYRKKLKELSETLLNTIPQANKNELSRYIIHRDMVVNILKLALNNELEIQQEWISKKEQGEKLKTYPEAIIHDLIFKRKEHGLPNDLWILNEEFVHFDGYSDIALENLEVNGKKLLKDNIDINEALEKVGLDKDTVVKERPDIFLFPEEGKCVLVEFKAPDVDLANHTTQIQKYARLIANYSRENGQFKNFYGYLIGNKYGVGIDSNWKKVPYGNSRIYPSYSITSIDETEAPIANLYQEMLLLSDIAIKAEIRNRSFAEKLGIDKKFENNND